MAKQITTFIPNQPGALARFCTFLKEQNIDMRAMNVSDAQDFGIVRVIVNDTDAAYQALRKNEFVCQVQDVLTIEVEDRPGSLVELLTTLGEEDVNIDYTYALFSRHEGTAGFVIKTGDRKRALEVLQKAGVKLIAQEEL